jgi:hypothetical protein
MAALKIRWPEISDVREIRDMSNTVSHHPQGEFSCGLIFFLLRVVATFATDNDHDLRLGHVESVRLPFHQHYLK